jgi:glyoxylase-like metal-dependent hydrolase (beta-lactamase superfamily II)
VEVTRIEDGLWRWTAVHPDWTPEEGGEEGWDPVVGCVSCECDDALLLVDPLAPGGGPDTERFWAALDRDVERLGLPVAVLLTVHWHERSAAAVRERYGAGVWAHADAVERLEVPVAHPFREGDPLPGGVRALPTGRGGEVMAWLPERRALVPGDVLLGTPGGGLRVCPASWFRNPRGPAIAREALRETLALPIERVLVSHGDPVLAGAAAALAAALEEEG